MMTKMAVALALAAMAGCTSSGSGSGGGGGGSSSRAGFGEEIGSEVGGSRFVRSSDTLGTQRRLDVYGGATAPVLPTIGAPGYGK